MIPHGHAVSLVTIFVCKQRCSYIGIDIQGDGHPTIVRSRDARFRVGDSIYMINGRLMHGTKKTATRIWWKSHMSITLMRCETNDDALFPISVVIDSATPAFS